MSVKSNDKAGWVKAVWDGLEAYRAFVIPEGQDVNSDEEWGDICTAMAWIQEELGVEEQVDG